MCKPIKKVVIPTAGIGSRLMPLTKYIPKELLPVGNKPMIQHAMEMYMDAGISEFCVITSPLKPGIRLFLQGDCRAAKLPYAQDTSFLKRLASCQIVFYTQQEPRGVADAISLAREFVGNEPFGCIMPDCILFSNKSFLAQLMTVFSKHRKNTIGTIWIDHSEAKRYGNVGLVKSTPLADTCFSIQDLSGKTTAPLRIPRGQKVQKGFGGGIYLPEYFEHIDLIRQSAAGEIDDVPIHHMLIKENNLHGVSLTGTPFDAGHPIGFRAAVHFAGRPGRMEP